MGEALQLQALQPRQGKYSRESSVYHKGKAKMKWILMASFLISMGCAGTIDPAIISHISTLTSPESKTRPDLTTRSHTPTTNGISTKSDTTKRPESTTQSTTTSPFVPPPIVPPPILPPPIVPPPILPPQYWPPICGPPQYGPPQYGPPQYGPPQYG